MPPKPERKTRRARLPEAAPKREKKPTIVECGHVLHIPQDANAGSPEAWYLCDATGRRQGKATMNAEVCNGMLKRGELIQGVPDKLTGGMIYTYSPITAVETAE